MPLSLTSRPRVVLFGDSLTQRGFEEQGWASALCDYYTRRADVLNRELPRGKRTMPSGFAQPPWEKTGYM